MSKRYILLDRNVEYWVGDQILINTYSAASIRLSL